MKEYISTYETHAIRLTVDNMDEVATICNGRITRTELPREEQCVTFWDSGFQYELEIGEWLIKEHSSDIPASFSSMYDVNFNYLYREL